MAIVVSGRDLQVIVDYAAEKMRINGKKVKVTVDQKKKKKKKGNGNQSQPNQQPQE